MPEIFCGISVSAGITAGRAVLLNQEIAVERQEIAQGEIKKETVRLSFCLEQYKQEIQIIIEQVKQCVSADELAILEAQILMVEDPELLKAMQHKVELEYKNAAWAADEVFSSYVAVFENLSGEYFKQRVSDIRAIRRRILVILSGQETEAELNPGSIIIAEDLGPAEALSLNGSAIAAIITEKGGRTSHTSILARALNIPAVVGVNGVINKVHTGDFLIVDGTIGQVIVNPSEPFLKEYQEKLCRQQDEQTLLRQLIYEPSVTLDGKSLELWANIGGVSEVFDALEQGAQGIGLFRTEFLYMNSDSLPTEEEQEAAYRTVLSAMQGRPVVIRTLDIGADKKLHYFPLASEDNPALGCRAIRLCLKEQEIFRTQMRALLKSSVAGNLWIMFPLIATLEELREAKRSLETVRQELEILTIPVSPSIKIGMMVEVPAAAINADLFASEIDFFSIGTNDLIQYLFAADRQNRDVDYLYQPMNSAVLRLISRIVEAGHAHGIPVGVCGEMAGEAEMTETLIGLGIDELSMSAGRILPVKKVLRSTDAGEAVRLLRNRMPERSKSDQSS